MNLQGRHDPYTLILGEETAKKYNHNYSAKEPYPDYSLCNIPADPNKTLDEILRVFQAEADKFAINIEAYNERYETNTNTPT